MALRSFIETSYLAFLFYRSERALFWIIQTLTFYSLLVLLINRFVLMTSWDWNLPFVLYFYWILLKYLITQLQKYLKFKSNFYNLNFSRVLIWTIIYLKIQKGWHLVRLPRWCAHTTRRLCRILVNDWELKMKIAR